MKMLLTATILLWSSWALAQSGTPTTTNDGSQNPGSSSPSTQQSDDKSQQAKSHHKGQTVVGCLSGAADTFVLTDASGKTYELLGATKQLQANVGHKVQLWGNRDSTGGGARTEPGGEQALFGVKKVKSLSDSCK
jgi:hypothetical protein